MAAINKIQKFTFKILELLDRLVHGFECVVRVAVYVFGVDRRDRVVHPAVVPSEPVGRCDPQVFIWVKVFRQFGQFVILEIIKLLSFFFFFYKNYSNKQASKI